MLVMSVVALAVFASRPFSRWPWRGRRPPIDEVRFSSTVASELRAGRSLRQSLEEGVGVSGAGNATTLRRSLASGVTLDEVAAHIGAALPTSGRAVAAAVQLAAASGGAVAPLFDRIAEQQRAVLEIERERRAATAQIRFSAVIVGALPLAVTLILFVSGRFGAVLTGGSLGLMVVVVGAVLQAAGLGLIGFLVRRGG